MQPSRKPKPVDRKWINWALMEVTTSGNDEMDIYEDEEGRYVLFGTVKVRLQKIKPSAQSVRTPGKVVYAGEAE